MLFVVLVIIIILEYYLHKMLFAGFSNRPFSFEKLQLIKFEHLLPSIVQHIHFKYPSIYLFQVDLLHLLKC